MNKQDKKILEQSQVELLQLRDTYNEWMTDAVADLLLWVNDRWPLMTLTEAHTLFTQAKDSVLYKIFKDGVEGNKTGLKETLEGYA